MFQPTPSLSFVQQINGLLSTFAFALITNRELLVDWDPDMDKIFLSPGWKWKFEDLFPTRPITHMIFDFVSTPSFIVPPAHKWRWANVLQSNLTEAMLQDSHQIIIINCDEFIAPFLWANPVYRQYLCKICNIDTIYANFASVLIKFSKKIVDLSNKIKNITGDSYSIAVGDSGVAALYRIRTMTDTMVRCMDYTNSSQNSWLFIRIKNSFSSIKWKSVGNHKILIYDELECLKKVKQDYQTATLYCLAMTSNAIYGFTGSHLAESLAYSSGKQLYVVLHRIPFCGEATFRLPTIEKWPMILNSPGINLTKFMVSEMNNYMNSRS